MKNKIKNKKLICLSAYLFVLFLAVSVDGAINSAIIGSGASINGCNEGCAGLGGVSSGNVYDFCFENPVSPYEKRGNEIIRCDCLQAVGGRAGGNKGQLMTIYNGDISYKSYYCCGGVIKKFYTADCTSEGIFENLPDTLFYYPPSAAYECYDPDDAPACIYNPWTPSIKWWLGHGWYTTPTHIIDCSNLKDARWRNKVTGAELPYSAGQLFSDCGTGGGGTGNSGAAVSGLCGSPGCSIILRGSFIKLDVPPNALKGSGKIVTTNNAFSGTVITIMKENPFLYGNMDYEGMENPFNILVAYKLMPQELEFALPPTITIGYDEDPTINEGRLDIYFYDEENRRWIAQNATIDKEKNELTINTSHLGVYALIMAIDTEPPVTKDDYQYNNTWVNRNAAIALSATDDLSGVKETLYCIGNNSCIPNISYKELISITAEGIRYLRYYSVDNAGNKEEIKETIIKIDKTAPELSLTLNPNQIWPPNKKEVDVKIDGYANDALSGVKTTEFELIDEYKEVATAITDFNTLIKVLAWRNGDDLNGRHYNVTVASEDNAGNIAVTSAAVLVPHDQRR